MLYPLFQWPYTTPLFYKSEEETLSKLQEQTRNLENIQRSSTSLESSQWEGSIRDIWSGSQRNVNEAFELASSDQTSVNKAKGCEKTCRRFLCAFLGLSFLGAILAGVGLTLICKFVHLHSFINCCLIDKIHLILLLYTVEFFYL